MRDEILDYIEGTKEVVDSIESEQSYEDFYQIVELTEEFLAVIENALEGDEYSDRGLKQVKDLQEQVQTFYDAIEDYNDFADEREGKTIWQDFIRFYDQLVNYMEAVAKIFKFDSMYA